MTRSVPTPLAGQGVSLGIEALIDNDVAHRQDPHLLPGLTRHRERPILDDRLGYRALWSRDVPQLRPLDLGDAEQVCDPTPCLGVSRQPPNGYFSAPMASSYRCDPRGPARKKPRPVLRARRPAEPLRASGLVLEKTMRQVGWHSRGRAARFHASPEDVKF